MCAAPREPSVFSCPMALLGETATLTQSLCWGRAHFGSGSLDPPAVIGHEASGEPIVKRAGSMGRILLFPAGTKEVELP